MENMVCTTCAGTDGDLAGVLDWIPRIVRKYGSSKDTTATIVMLAREAYRRYGRRLVAEDHA